MPPCSAMARSRLMTWYQVKNGSAHSSRYSHGCPASQNAASTMACPAKKRRLSGRYFGLTSPVNRGLTMRHADTPAASRMNLRRSDGHGTG